MTGQLFLHLRDDISACMYVSQNLNSLLEWEGVREAGSSLQGFLGFLRIKENLYLSPVGLHCKVAESLN